MLLQAMGRTAISGVARRASGRGRRYVPTHNAEGHSCALGVWSACGQRVVSVWSSPGRWPRDRPGNGSGRCVTDGVWSSPGRWPRDRPGTGTGRTSGGGQPTTWHRRNHCCAPIARRVPAAVRPRWSRAGRHAADREGALCASPRRWRPHRPTTGRDAGLGYRVPRGTTQSCAWPANQAMRSKSAS